MTAGAREAWIALGPMEERRGGDAQDLEGTDQEPLVIEARGPPSSSIRRVAEAISSTKMNAKLSVLVLAVTSLALACAVTSVRSLGDSAQGVAGLSDVTNLNAMAFTKVSGLNCFPYHGASLLSDEKSHLGRMSFEDCKQECASRSECDGVLVVSDRDFGYCWLRRDIDVSKCIGSSSWDLHVKPGIDIPRGDLPQSHAESNASQTASIDGNTSFFSLEGYDCWGASQPAPEGADPVDAKDVDACKKVCVHSPGCEGIIVGRLKYSGACWLRSSVDLARCKPNEGYNPQDWDFYWRKQTAPALLEPSGAPLQEFYMYRATAPGNLARYTLGEVNTGNLDGVLWYLRNEIVTEYSGPPRCPRRFNISKVHRFKVKVRTTLPMVQDHMSFGVRFAFDQGRCTGRCFPANKCTGRGDCAHNFNKYGYVVGCNKFVSRYPFPDEETKAYVSTPNGIWYSIPIEGRCEGEPTGTQNCTWSYEEAGELSLEEIESLSPGGDNCCNGTCTNFWAGGSSGDMYWRVGQVMDMFKKRFPDWPRDMQTPPCDFNPQVWYAGDAWPRQDPWR